MLENNVELVIPTDLLLDESFFSQLFKKETPLEIQLYNKLKLFKQATEKASDKEILAKITNFVNNDSAFKSVVSKLSQDKIGAILDKLKMDTPKYATVYDKLSPAIYKGGQKLDMDRPIKKEKDTEK